MENNFDFGFSTNKKRGEELDKIEIPSYVNTDSFDLSEYNYDKGRSFPCDNCDTTGIAGVCREEPFDGQMFYCNCQFAKRKHLNNQLGIEENFDNAGIPKRLHGITFETAKDVFSQETLHSQSFQTVKNLARNFMCQCPATNNMREGIILFGDNGVGKSGLLVILAREYWKAGFTPLYIKYIDLIKKGIQTGYDEYNKRGIQMSYIRTRIACTCDVLIIDDLGDPFERTYSNNRKEHMFEQETKDRREILFNVIAERHERQLPTLFSGNYKGLNAISKQFSPRIASRIKEMCAIVTLHNHDLRE